MDAVELLGEAFTKRLHEVVERHPELYRLHEDEVVRLARDAVDAIVGPVLWRELLGEDRLDTAATARMLGITRQALHKRVRCGGLLGVPGRGTTWFPGWQFDRQEHSVRPVVPQLLAAFASAAEEDGPAPEAVLAWSQTPQPELGDQAPADWVAADGLDEPVVAAARRAGRALAA
jgi:hypothetical protein